MRRGAIAYRVKGGPFAFVVHKHRATSLHYDFRLEIAGVMPSWSIPKGPTLDPSVRRLAMPTGPHELSYRLFEGVIPKGSYGAGPVMIWDRGTYSPELEPRKGVRVEVTDGDEASKVAQAEFAEGALKFVLHGEKLNGSFALIRTKGLAGKEAWLLIKHRDSFAVPGFDANDYDFSAATGRTLAEIAGEGKVVRLADSSL